MRDSLRVFESYRELSAAYDSPADAPGAYRGLPSFGPAGFRCDDCGVIGIMRIDGATGYAIADCRDNDKSSGRMICYRCADAGELRRIQARAGRFTAYLSGNLITSWTGGALMRVIRSAPCKLTRRSHWHDSRSYRSIRAVDPFGGHWFGRGSSGVCITLRPCKS